MMARKRARPRRKPRNRRSQNQQLVTFPVGVLIRDNNDKVFYLSLAQLAQYRRMDLEVPSVLNQMQAGPDILGLQNAWLVESTGDKSGD
jgi:hypothetical protein